MSLSFKEFRKLNFLSKRLTNRTQKCRCFKNHSRDRTSSPSGDRKKDLDSPLIPKKIRLLHINSEKMAFYSPIFLQKVQQIAH